MWQLRFAVRRIGFERPVLWINDVTYAPLIERTGWPSLYDVTDDWLLAPLPQRERERLRRLDALALSVPMKSSCVPRRWPTPRQDAFGLARAQRRRRRPLPSIAAAPGDLRPRQLPSTWGRCTRRASTWSSWPSWRTRCLRSALSWSARIRSASDHTDCWRPFERASARPAALRRCPRIPSARGRRRRSASSLGIHG